MDGDSHRSSHRWLTTLTNTSTMNASYDDITVGLYMPVRVYFAQCNDTRAVIFFDFFGQPAQISFPAQAQPDRSLAYATSRSILHTLAMQLKAPWGYIRPYESLAKASVASLRLVDLMQHLMPLTRPFSQSSQAHLLNRFLCSSRRHFVLAEEAPGQPCVMDDPGFIEDTLLAEDVSPIQFGVPGLLAADLVVVPERCGNDRISGHVYVGLEMEDPDGAYTFVCMREIGKSAASEGRLRAMAFRIQQLELIMRARHGLASEQASRAVCVPDIKAFLYCELPGKLGKYPVGFALEHLKGLVPLDSSGLRPEQKNECKVKICNTVEWLVVNGIGWG
ncbi:FAD binding domain-containing protein [Cordyceps javanica]|uniref:FAD binding domain-containing protein n=1 Tax=Cordyceps javanica TaxID=43265 RepID=A0A545VCG2_9HYPO|nr:FAD binding domain-containing protein [Cordyceps javanica]TQW10925.1 FAD binding domain protein [Cordyceps javanica]